MEVCKQGAAQQRLRDSGFRLLVTRIVDYAIYMLDPVGRVVSWNAGAQILKGYREDEVIGQHFSLFYGREDIDRGKPEHGLEMALTEGHFEDEGWRVRKDGSMFWASVVITAIRDEANKLLGFAKVTRDMTERHLAMEQIKASEARLQHTAMHDALTGVPNRALLGERADHAIALSRRSNRLLALLFIDLDEFKEVNDGLGHAVGDEVLRQVATRFSRCLREADTLARYGGDEFVALLEDIEGPEEVEQVTARMQAVLAQPFIINAQPIPVTGSIGVALYPRDGETLSMLIEKSDLAMYRAKELGRNSVQFYTPALDQPGNKAQ